jgi:hypothetical protein
LRDCNPLIAAAPVAFAVGFLIRLHLKIARLVTAGRANRDFNGVQASSSLPGFLVGKRGVKWMTRLKSAE